MALVCALALMAFNGALGLWMGYDAIGTLRATSSVYHHSTASIRRPYWFWLFGSPTASGVMPALALAAPRRAQSGGSATHGLFA